MEHIHTQINHSNDDNNENKVNEEIILTKKETQEIANGMHKFNTTKSKVVVEIAESNFDDKITQKREIKRKRIEMGKGK